MFFQCAYQAHHVLTLYLLQLHGLTTYVCWTLHSAHVINYTNMQYVYLSMTSLIHCVCAIIIVICYHSSYTTLGTIADKTRKQMNKK